MIKVLFVCMGNICRSPTAHGVFEQMVEKANLENRIEVDSAGTHSYHIGNPPDSRSIQTALNHGVPMKHLRARLVEVRDFETYDFILAMDKDNLKNLLYLCPEKYASKCQLFLDYADDDVRKKYSEVPDPYYTTDGFEDVFNMIENASKGLLTYILKK